MSRLNCRITPSRSRAFTAALLVLVLVPFGCEDPALQPPPATAIDSPEAVVQALSRAYQTWDPNLFASILAHDPDAKADYSFLLGAPSDLGKTQWGHDEEVRIHRRMFQPQNLPEGDPPVASELWLQDLQITLTPMEPFGERTDLYTTHGGALDPTIWRAMGARYATYVFFDLVGTAYKVEGEASFVVVEDLRKSPGTAGKFLLWIWEDIDLYSRSYTIPDVPPSSGSTANPWKAPVGAARRVSWGSVKGLYK